MKMRALLVRGMVAGLAAAVCAFAFSSVVGEPAVIDAIAFEEASAADHHDDTALEGHGDETEAAVSRGVQRTFGLGAGLAILGVGYGGFFAIAFASASGRLGLGARGTALYVALAGWAAVVVVPFLKYPANPPAVGDPETIARRTALHLVTIGAGVLLVVGATMLQRRLASTRSGWDATLIAGAALVAAVAAVYLLMPGVDEVPAGFPASTLWEFRVASLGTQLVLWAGIGLTFGALTERSLRREGAPRPAVVR